MSTTTILGISAFYHDSAAALVRDGVVVAAAQEERFTRKKHDPGFPEHAVAYCLNEAGLKPDQLNYVAFYDKPMRKFERLIETYIAFAPSGFRSFSMAIPVWLREKLLMRRIIPAGLPGKTSAPLLFMDHHESHAASAFFPSPFEEAAILCHYPCRLQRARPDSRSRAESAIVSGVTGISRGDWLPGACKYQLQRPRRAYCVYAGGCVPLLPGDGDGCACPGGFHPLEESNEV
jgi:hypothetical protein